AFAEPGERREPALARGGIEHAVGTEAGGEPDRLLEGVDWPDLVAEPGAIDAPDKQPEAVRPEVDRRQQAGHVGCWHGLGERPSWHESGGLHRDEVCIIGARKPSPRMPRR